MGGRLSHCYIAYAYPYILSREKQLIRESFEALEESKPNFSTDLLSVPMPQAPCPGLAMGVATNIFSVDSRFTQGLIESHVTVVIDFLRHLITDLHLDQTKVTDASELFALQHLCKGRLTLSTVGVLVSMLIAFIRVEIQPELLAAHYRANSGRSASRLFSFEANSCTSGMEVGDNRELVRAWRKLARYSLACMSETVEVFRRSQEDNHSRPGSFLSRTFPPSRASRHRHFIYAAVADD